MAQRTAIGLTGDDLTVDDVWAVAVEGTGAELSDQARERMRAARELVERAAHGSREHTYGVNTGFGRFVAVAIPEEQTGELQLRLLRSHACGVGEPYPDEIVRAAMLLRANALAKGNSGARVETVELLLALLDRGVLPVVPSRGSVGASGDLAPLAHLALPLVGEGEAWIEGERLTGAEALARAGLEPVQLAAKEGLSLVNGTQFMAAMLALGLVRARRLARAADVACALSVEALQGSRTSFLPQIHALRPLRGQKAAAANVLRLLEGSAIIEAHRWCDKVQDAYSLRCAPQVHGACRDLLEYAEYTAAVELNAATDNPLVLVDDEVLVSNGNFHGQPLAFALDALAMAAAELANISERRLERLVNPNLSEGLPAFLTTDGGLNSGFMIPQYVAASLVSENKVLCHPASVDSIPTSAGQEDHVSMGNAAGLKAWQVLANSERRGGDRAARGLRRRSSSTRRSSPEPAGGRRGRPCAQLSPRLRDDRPLGGRHRGRRRRDPRRLAARCGRGGRRGAGVSTTATLAERVEALVGDLSSIRAPRGTDLNARQWSTEAPLRMLLNNLDAEVAERPEELVVYGGSGKAARNHEALRAIVAALLELGPDETLLVQSGKPVGVFTTHEGAPRVLIANSLLVPKWATWDEFRRLEAEGLTMFGQMTAGSWIYIGSQGILQGTYQTFAAAGEKHFGSPDLRGRTILTAGLGGMGGAQPLAGTMAGAAILCVEVDPHADRAPARDALPRRGGGLARRRARASARRGGRAAAALGRAARECGRRRARARCARGGVRPDHRPDRRPRPAQRLCAARLLGGGGGRPALVRSGRVPTAGPGVDRPPRRGAARVRPARCLCFRLWQQPAG